MAGIYTIVLYRNTQHDSLSVEVEGLEPTCSIKKRDLQSREPTNCSILPFLFKRTLLNSASSSVWQSSYLKKSDSKDFLLITLQMFYGIAQSICVVKYYFSFFTFFFFFFGLILLLMRDFSVSTKLMKS